jgi:hypothetical protein
LSQINTLTIFTDMWPANISNQQFIRYWKRILKLRFL